MSVPALEEQAFYTPKEVAVVCRMPYRSVIEQIRAGAIPSEKFGRLYKVPAWWVQKHRGETKPVLHVVPEPTPVPAPDYAPLASVLEILGTALVQAAGALRGAS